MMIAARQRPVPVTGAAACPFCGNDRIVHVNRLVGGESERRAFCAGALGCHAWWNAATLAPVPAPTETRLPGGLVLP